MRGQLQRPKKHKLLSWTINWTADRELITDATGTLVASVTFAGVHPDCVKKRLVVARHKIEQTHNKL